MAHAPRESDPNETERDAPPRFCFECGRSKRGDEYGCPACGCDIYAARVTGDGPDPDVDALAAEGKLGGVLGRVLVLPPGYVCLLSGPRGVGKSSIAFTAFERPEICTSEMDPALIRAYCRRLGVQPEWINWIHRHEDGTVDLGVSGTPLELVIDSISATDDALGVLLALKAYCRESGARGIAIAHVTKAGKIAGQERLAHEADAVVEIGPDTATSTKSRFNPLATSLFRLTGDGVAVPQWDRYYSIEGRAPGYWVCPFPPVGRARHAAVLRKASESGPDGLPPAPLAVSAQDGGKLYGGWKEPADGAARCAFALQHGLAYYNAETGDLHSPEEE